MDWLVASIAVSVVLTLALDVTLRAFPGAGARAARKLDAVASRADSRSRRTRVVVPWKAMLVASLVLTVALNLALR